MTEVTVDMKVDKYFPKKFFVLKNEIGLYWIVSNNFTKDISMAKIYRKKETMIKTAQFLLTHKEQLSEHKPNFEKLYIQEVKLVEC